MTTTTYAARGRAGRARSFGPVHAVPATDTTGSALCGAPVRRGQQRVPAHDSASGTGAVTCPECAAAWTATA